MISLEKFDDNWSYIIRDIIKITRYDEEVNMYFKDQIREQLEHERKTGLRKDILANYDGIEKEIDKEVLELNREDEEEKVEEGNDQNKSDSISVDVVNDWDKLKNPKKEMTPPNLISNSIRDMSNHILSSVNEDVIDVDVKDFSSKKEGFKISIDTEKVKQKEISEFFNEFCELDISELYSGKFNSPDILYFKEMCYFNKPEPVANYIIWILVHFKDNSIEYKVLRDLLLMCLIYQDVMIIANNRLTTMISRLNLDMSRFYLRVGMLFSVSELEVSV